MIESSCPFLRGSLGVEFIMVISSSYSFKNVFACDNLFSGLSARYLLLLIVFFRP